MWYNLSMRIIAGKYKGKKLKEFELSSTRPTSDLVKGAVFNILGQKVVNSVFLDLFAGTGAMGIEAISRGAKQVIFVDSNKMAIDIIRDNLNTLKDENYLVKNENFIDVLKNLNKIDIIYIDPPYASDYAEKALKIIKNNDILTDSGTILWEHDETKNNILSDEIITKKYGKKFVSIIKKLELEKIINI